MTYLAVDLHMRIGLLDETKHHAETKARALTDFLGGKEGVEDLFQVCGGNSGAGVAYRDHDVVSRRDLAVHVCVGFIEANVVGLEGELSTGGHRIAGIQRKVQNSGGELVWTDKSRPRILLQQWGDFDLFPECRLQQLRGFED